MERELWQFFVDHRPSLVVNIARVFATVGDETVLLPFAVLILLYGSVSGKRTITTLGPAVAMLPTFVVVRLLKTLFDRDRPPVISALVEVSSASMPSGHAAYAAALAATTWVLVTDAPRSAVWRTLSVVGALLAGIARMVLGVHWFGGVIGFCVVSALGKRLQSDA
jgi:undecaprenyl-diphosphatase